MHCMRISRICRRLIIFKIILQDNTAVLVHEKSPGGAEFLRRRGFINILTAIIRRCSAANTLNLPLLYLLIYSQSLGQVVFCHTARNLYPAERIALVSRHPPAVAAEAESEAGKVSMRCVFVQLCKVGFAAP